MEGFVCRDKVALIFSYKGEIEEQCLDHFACVIVLN